jgi:hypothetical protein
MGTRRVDGDMQDMWDISTPLTAWIALMPLTAQKPLEPTGHRTHRSLDPCPMSSRSWRSMYLCIRRSSEGTTRLDRMMLPSICFVCPSYSQIGNIQA